MEGRKGKGGQEWSQAWERESRRKGEKEGMRVEEGVIQMEGRRGHGTEQGVPEHPWEWDRWARNSLSSHIKPTLLPLG